MLYNHISELIGNTPLLKLDSQKTGLKNIDLYAKLEYMNPF
jgi:cysteine synthase B